MGKSLIDLESYPVKYMLPLLLKDNTTTKRVGGTQKADGRMTGFKVVPKNILWATNTYKSHGRFYDAESQITEDLITGSGRGIIQPRVYKSQEDQVERTRKHAEVFTPTWICCKMNDVLDEDWFGRKDVFFKQESQTWTPTEGKVEFPKKKTWKQYIDSRRLEITCGEAPFLVSRYDAATGEVIEQNRRIGILDRKLRVVNENAETEDEWMKWCIRAFQSVYGYEYQGDNLLVARINLLMTFVDAVENRWGRKPTNKELHTISTIIAWNLWQMDGLKGTIPFRAPKDSYEQIDMEEYVPHPEQMSFDIEDSVPEKPKCKVNDWRSQRSIEFNSLQERVSSMRFDYVIGNPPYQDDMEGTSDNPVYHLFMDSANSISNATELITPGRFLFDAGKTPKDWNKKMLSDEHLKVLYYEPKSENVFANTDIKGGVVITMHDMSKKYQPIHVFTTHAELTSIVGKVCAQTKSFLGEIVFAPESYKFTKKMYDDHSEIKTMTTVIKGKTVPVISNGHDYDLTSNIFDKLCGIVFFSTSGNDTRSIQIFGRKNNERVSYYINREYIAYHPNLDKYKVFFPKANGAGRFGEVMTQSDLGDKGVGHTQTFISIGAFDTKEEAVHLQRYLKCKFARALLYVLKVTQDNKKSVWAYVPLQDFTSNSDIDWSQSVADIDKQLYKKYGLNQQEIDFIETHVKEMV